MRYGAKPYGTARNRHVRTHVHCRVHLTGGTAQRRTLQPADTEHDTLEYCRQVRTYYRKSEVVRVRSRGFRIISQSIFLLKTDKPLINSVKLVHNR